MTYEETLDFLFTRRASIYKGLKRIRYVLEKLGNPQDTFPAILITGTNGKGSTAKMLSSILAEAGYRIGCFTSPHLIDFRERITINGEYISQEEVIALTEEIRTGPFAQLEEEREALDIAGIVSFFETATAMAFTYFSRQHVDLAVLEVGIGGRLDATNTSNPLVSVITNVGLDHQQFLGDTIAQIAREKSAIIRKGGDVVIGNLKPEALSVIEEVCHHQQATLYSAGIQADASPQTTHTVFSKKVLPTGSIFSYRGMRSYFEDLSLSLVGKHQLVNVAVVLGTLEVLADKGFPVEEESIRIGLSHVIHPGRLELLQRNPRVVVDIAHNFMGSSAIANALPSIFGYEKLIVVIGVLHDKDVKGILRPFLEIASSMIFTSPHKSYRAEAASETADIAAGLIESGVRQGDSKLGTRVYEHWQIQESVADAIAEACAIAGEHDLICITGSNYTVSEAEIYFARNIAQEEGREHYGKQTH